MKKSIAVLFVLIFGVMIFAGCSMDPTDADSLVGTKWEWAVAGTGARLEFTSATEVTESVIAAGMAVSSTDYTYEYDATTQTGWIDGTWEFSINDDGDELTYLDLVYEYKAF